MTPDQKQAIKAVIEELGADGHSIIAPKFFIEKGIDKAVVEGLTTEHVSSDTDPKWMISKGSKRVAKLKGVYSLDFLRWAARELNAKAEGSYFGRGRQAQALVTAIQKALE